MTAPSLLEAARKALDAPENHAMQRTFAGGVLICEACIVLREAIADAEKAQQWTDKMPLHPDCRNRCQTADDYGVWPEHSCNASCEYLRNPPPQSTTRKGDA